jgi:ABC-type glycerol-3-phosphate transport system substrate-binding protein
MNIRPFEIGLIAVFVIAGIIGIIALKGYQDEKSDEEQLYGNTVTMWGTFEQPLVESIFTEIVKTDKAFSVVKYRAFDERSIEGEIVNAIADGTPPDLVLMPHTMLVSLRTKLTAIPFETLDERTLRNTYIDGAEIFTLSNGTYAIPFAVDPLVLFWNKDLFARAGLAQPPRTWEMLVSDVVPSLTEYDAGRKISQSALGMGEYTSVRNAKEILSMLLLQSGTTIIEEQNEKYQITLLKSADGMGGQPAEAALTFYTQFSSPASSAYTWSRTLQSDRNAFTGGKLAMYLGFGTEIDDIEIENPNLSFDIAPVPQAQGATALRNYGTFYGFAIPKASRNSGGAYAVATKLSGSAVARQLTNALDLVPAQRALYSGATGDVYEDILRESALVSRGWLDPAPRESASAFKTMIDEVTSGRKEIERVVNDAVYTLEALFR